MKVLGYAEEVKVDERLSVPDLTSERSRWLLVGVLRGNLEVLAEDLLEGDNVECGGRNDNLYVDTVSDGAQFDSRTGDCERTDRRSGRR